MEFRNRIHENAVAKKKECNATITSATQRVKIVDFIIVNDPVVYNQDIFAGVPFPRNV